MKERRFYNRLAICAIGVLMLGAVAYAQPSPVDIPDPNLRAAIADVLNIAHDAPITQEDMNRLADLDAQDQGIANLTGLEFATNLTFLQLQANRIEDISPLANLIQLTELHLGGNRIEDISSLANLTQLTVLRLNEIGRIEDISSLANLTQLRRADLDRNQIVDVSPLVRLTKLESLDIRGNRITDASPLANLTQLTELRLSNNQIIDVTPLANLTNLAALWLSDNRITDVIALRNLTQLTELRLDNNRIVDASTLARLTKLESLDLRGNRVTDFSPLDGLALIQFLYDESCESPPFSVRDRIENRDYPSIFARWSGRVPIRNRPELSHTESLASHDLWFSVPMFGLRFEFWPEEIKLVGNLDEAMRRRGEFLTINPNMVFLVQVRMRSGGSADYLPEDSPYWIRDAEGNFPAGDRLIDFTHPFIQDRIVQQAIAVSKCGLYDGIMFDWWNEHDAVLVDRLGDLSHKFRGNEAEQRARDNVIRRIRAATRPDFLIMGNTNDDIIPRTGPYMNGSFMETSIPHDLTGDHLERRLTQVENSLLWLDENLREPRINGLEGWVIPTEPPDSPMNRRWIRAITTLSLTHSDGYVSFTSIVDDYGHYWYDFWDADLGRPVSPKVQLYDDEIPGLYIREYTNGWAVYNHSGEQQVVNLPEETQGVSSGVVNTQHALSNLDGEMYLRVKPPNPADVNGDGVVNILDLTLVAQALGTDKPDADVNGDGFVNILDLVFVANEF